MATHVKTATHKKTSNHRWKKERICSELVPCCLVPGTMRCAPDKFNSQRIWLRLLWQQLSPFQVEANTGGTMPLVYKNGAAHTNCSSVPLHSTCMIYICAISQLQEWPKMLAAVYYTMRTLVASIQMTPDHIGYMQLIFNTSKEGRQIGLVLGYRGRSENQTRCA